MMLEIAYNTKKTWNPIFYHFDDKKPPNPPTPKVKVLEIA